MEEVDHLEGTVSAIEAELVVVWNVNTFLSRQLYEADRCCRRSCMIAKKWSKKRLIKYIPLVLQKMKTKQEQ